MVNDFPDEINPGNRKTTQFVTIVEGLRKKEYRIAPADYTWLGNHIRADQVQADGEIEISWGRKKARFTAEIKSTSTPRVLDVAMHNAKQASTPKAPPLVIVPYLSEESMRTLEANRVSGFDLCGNVIILDGGLYIWRGGQPNRYPENRPIKNIYRGRGSVFARCFLLKSEFSSLGELREFAVRRLDPKYLLEPSQVEDDSRLAVSTASKVISALVEDRIVERTPARIALSCPRMLVYKLKTNFNHLPDHPILGKTNLSPYEAWDRLRAAVESGELSAATTGLGSAAHYGALATESRISLRVSDKIRAMELLEVTPSRAFPNVEIFEDEDETALFDCRLDNRIIWASPIQTLLELATGGPREKDAAEQFETRLLDEGAARL